MAARTASPTALYEWNDGCFFPSMLTEPGQAFAASYFDFSNGKYIQDYEELLATGLPSVFHVPNTWSSYDQLAPKIQSRYEALQAGESRRC